MAKTTTEVKAPENEAEVAALTDELAALTADMERMKARKVEIEAMLAAWARMQPQAKLADSKREGRQVVATGSRSRATVVFTADLLIGSFKDNSPKHNALLGVLEKDGGGKPAAELLELFFRRPSSWESRIDDGVKFRASAAEWLQPEVAAAFVAECRAVDKYGIAKSKTVVTAERVEAGEGQQA